MASTRVALRRGCTRQDPLHCDPTNHPERLTHRRGRQPRGRSSGRGQSGGRAASTPAGRRAPGATAAPAGPASYPPSQGPAPKLRDKNFSSLLCSGSEGLSRAYWLGRAVNTKSPAPPTTEITKPPPPLNDRNRFHGLGGGKSGGRRGQGAPRASLRPPSLSPAPSSLRPVSSHRFPRACAYACVRVHVCEDSGQSGSRPTHVTSCGFSHLCADPVSRYRPFLGLRAYTSELQGTRFSPRRRINGAPEVKAAGGKDRTGRQSPALTGVCPGARRCSP